MKSSEAAASTLKGVFYLLVAMALSMMIYSLFDGPKLAEQEPVVFFMATAYFIVLGVSVLVGLVRYAKLVGKSQA